MAQIKHRHVLRAVVSWNRFPHFIVNCVSTFSSRNGPRGSFFASLQSHSRMRTKRIQKSHDNCSNRRRPISLSTTKTDYKPVTTTHRWLNTCVCLTRRLTMPQLPLRKYNQSGYRDVIPCVTEALNNTRVSPCRPLRPRLASSPGISGMVAIKLREKKYLRERRPIQETADPLWSALYVRFRSAAAAGRRLRRNGWARQQRRLWDCSDGVVSQPSMAEQTAAAVRWNTERFHVSHWPTARRTARNSDTRAAFRSTSGKVTTVAC